MRVTEDQELAVSKLLSGDEDSFKNACASASTSKSCPATVSQSISVGFPSSVSSVAPSSVSYNNCTVNMFAAPSPMMGYPPPPNWQQRYPYEPAFDYDPTFDMVPYSSV